MRTISLLAIGALLCCGCKRNSASKEPIIGAFGWALGARLPMAFEVQTNSGSLRYIDPRGNVAPFDQVVLDLTADRTIFAITGNVAAKPTEAFGTLEKSLTETLGKKHALRKKTSEGGITRLYYGDDVREVILATTTAPQSLALCYRDTAFARQAQQELLASNAASAAPK